MQELLSNPAVQGGVAPLLAALVVTLALRPVRLAGVSLIAAFIVSVHLVSGLQFTPLTVTRKIVLIALVAPLIGLLVDFAFKPTRIGIAVAAAAAAGAALWAFWPVLSQKSAQQAWLLGGSAAFSAAFTSAIALSKLSTDPVRAGAAALAVGIGTGIAAIFSASVLYGTYGLAVAAAAGGFLLPQMITGKKVGGTATFSLTAAILGALLAGGAMVLAQLPWYLTLVLALIPAAALLPVPQKARVWLQAVVISFYGLAIAALACFLAWPSSQSS